MLTRDGLPPLQPQGRRAPGVRPATAIRGREHPCHAAPAAFRPGLGRHGAETACQTSPTRATHRHESGFGELIWEMSSESVLPIPPGGQHAVARSARRFSLTGLGIALALGAVLRWTLPSQVADLRPRPDALEYEEAARNLAHGEGYSLRIAGAKYPPRPPFGFSALLVPFLWVFGDQPGTGIWAVLVAALAAIAATWALGRVTGGPASGIAAAGLLALSPLHVRWSRAVMSDVPSSAAVAGIALWALVARQRGARAVEWFAIAGVAGVAAAIRPSSLLLVVPILVLSLPGRATSLSLLVRLLTVGAGVLVGLLPELIYNAVRFGSPLSGGYALWVPGHDFSWRFAFTPPPFAPAGDGTEPNLIFYLRVLAGGGQLYPWPIGILILAGSVVAVRQRGAARGLTVIALGFAASLVAADAVFFSQWDRYVLPAAPLLLALASVPFGAGMRPPIRVGAVALAAATLLLIGRAGNPYALPNRDLGEVAALRIIARETEPDAALLLRTNVFFFDRFFRTDGANRIWVPLEYCEHRWRIRMRGLSPYASAERNESWIRDAIYAPFDPARAERAIRELPHEGHPVYFSDLLGFQVPFMRDMARLLTMSFAVEPKTRLGPWTLFRVRER